MARRCGFDDLRQFRRLWARYHNSPPSVFRQGALIAGKVVFFQIENGDSVDQLRAQMGMSPLKEYKKTLEDIYGL